MISAWVKRDAHLCFSFPWPVVSSKACNIKLFLSSYTTSYQVYNDTFCFLCWYWDILFCLLPHPHKKQGGDTIFCKIKQFQVLTLSVKSQTFVFFIQGKARYNQDNKFTFLTYTSKYTPSRKEASMPSSHFSIYLAHVPTSDMLGFYHDQGEWFRAFTLRYKDLHSGACIWLSVVFLKEGPS